MEVFSPAALVDPLVTTFVLATMFSVGLELRIDDVLASVSQFGLVMRSVFINLVGVPVLAMAAVLIAPLKTGHTVGLLLIAVSPGAPFGPKLAEISNSNVAFASGLMVMLATVSVFTIPASLALLVPGNVGVNLFGMAWMVIVVQLLPLLVGFGLREGYQALASTLHAPMRRFSTILLFVLVALLLAINVNEIGRLVGTGVMIISSVIVVCSMIAGYAFGGPDKSTREVLATSTTARNAAIALLVATTSFPSPDVLVTIIAFSLVSVIVPGITASVWRSRSLPFDIR
ncbi:bile acid:sodium symporter family protein [Haloarcula sp. JP-L23]|uniref:bile acid:sodium symporter family protein n=1 Tax=Haloarcula sp. JP-L23 TaxID=2716717 RepID=UPI00140F23CE|nr:sodium symporter [Haloarcula sp. JP-L23]